MPRDWDALFSTEQGVSDRALVIRLISSVIRPNGQRDDPRLIGCRRRRVEQLRFIGSQALDTVPSALIAIVLEALHQFAGP